MKKNKINRVLSILLVTIMCASMCTVSTVTAQDIDTQEQIGQPENETKEVNLGNPRIQPDSAMKSGQKVIWDCVWFGSYPQAEIVLSAEEYTSVDKDVMKDGDIIVDNILYKTLQNSTEWNDNQEITLEGNKYRRVKMEDASSTSSLEGYYGWDDADNYHYFKYEPIKWRILEINGSQAFLISDIVLDAQSYHSAYESVTWESSALRKWLNGYENTSGNQQTDGREKNFIRNAFSSEEISAIVDAQVMNANNSIFETDGGNNTKDKLFLLSERDAYGESASSYGFALQKEKEDEARRCKSSTFAKAMGIGANVSDESKGNCDWWLRTPGKYSDQAMEVGANGLVDYDGPYVNATCGIRPALSVNVSSVRKEYAGTVGSDGTVQEEGSEGEGGDTGESGGDAETETPSDQIMKDNIRNALPGMSNLGTATLKGPEVSILGNKFNIFQTNMKMDIPLNNTVKIKIDGKKKTAEVLLGVLDKKIDTEDDNVCWSETYKDVKSFIEKCGGTVNTTELWNKFSSVRGKLKKLDADAVFKAKGNVAGYLKLQMDDTGNIQKVLEGGIALGFNAGASVKTRLCWVVYSEFGVGGSVDGKIYLKAQNAKVITPEGEITLAIKPTIALGADAVVVDVKGGIEGKIAGKVTFPWEQFEKSVSIFVTGKFFIKVDSPIPKLSTELPYNFSTMELYPDLGKVSKSMSALQYTETEPITKQMVRELAGNSGNAVDTTEKALVYENAKPEMIRFSDGKLLMVYLDDSGGQVKCTYRIYDGKEWSESKVVWEGGNLDTAGHLYQYNDSLYVIFESSNREITEDMTAEQIAEAMELYVARFDGSRFDEPVMLGKSGTWKYAYQLEEHNGTLCAIWAENSENDIMLQSGKTIIYESDLNSIGREPIEILNVEQVLTEVVFGTVGNSFVTAYIKGDQLYIGDRMLDISSIGEKADSLKIQDGLLYARVDGMLCAYDGEQFETKNVECSTAYRIYGDSVYWIQQDNFNSEIFVKSMDSEAIPISITDEGGYVGGFAVEENTEGEPVVSYTYQQVNENTEGNPYGATILKFMNGITRYQAEVTDVAYDILSFMPGQENPIDVTICNTGTETINQVTLTISDGNKVLYDEEVTASLKAGESKECDILVTIPEDFSKENLNFALAAKEPFERNEFKKYEIEYCNTDIEVMENNSDEIIVQNNSQSIARNVIVILRDRDEKGTDIRKISVGDLETGSIKTMSVKEDWKKVSKISGTDRKYMYCSVMQDADEYELWNNSIVIEKQVDGETDESNGNNVDGGNANKPNVSVKTFRIVLSGISKKIAAGKKIKLNADILPANASNKSIVWKSSNNKVATVNNSGIVTMNKKSGGKSVTITAMATDGSGVKASYKINSMKGVVKKVSISGKKTVKAGKTLKLKVKVTATSKANKKLKWTSSNTKYATVSSSGKVKAFKEGKGKKVKITAAATDGSGKKKTITVKIQ